MAKHLAEHLIVENFCGIHQADIHVNKINVFIGRQSSGKSTTAKLIYFFKELIQLIARDIGHYANQQEITQLALKRFESYFPKSTWTNGAKIKYYFSEMIFIDIVLDKTPSIIYSSALENEITLLFEKKDELSKQYDLIHTDSILGSSPLFLNSIVSRTLRHEFSKRLAVSHIHIPDNQVFIPAGRSFFSIFRKNLISMLGASENLDLDSFLVKFGVLYERLREPETLFGDEYEIPVEYEKIIFNILNAKHAVEDDIDYLIHTDGRKVNVSNASSGQQESLPLLVILKALLAKDSYLYSGEKLLYIEEPEAHLYPESQLEMMKLLSILGNKDDTQIIITTHSPYILSYFNNLLLRSKVGDSSKENINLNDISAYFFNRENVDFLVDYENELILAPEFDAVSENISNEFSELINKIYE